MNDVTPEINEQINTGIGVMSDAGCQLIDKYGTAGKVSTAVFSGGLLLMTLSTNAMSDRERRAMRQGFINAAMLGDDLPPEDALEYLLRIETFLAPLSENEQKCIASVRSEIAGRLS